MLQPGIVGVAHWWAAKLPADIFTQLLAVPVADVERRVGKDEIGFEVRVTIVQKGVTQLEAGFDATDGKVHLCQPQGGGVRFLPKNGKVANGTPVFVHKAFGLHKHTSTAAAAVINASTEGLTRSAKLNEMYTG